MSVASLVDLRLHNAGLRQRSVAELHADLAAGCESLGNLGAEWRASGFVPDADLVAVDRTVTGLLRLLIDLRVARGDQHAA
jgi:hypothetical protein